jgi:hypothetical protein
VCKLEAQDSSRVSLFIEAGGAGGYGSLNGELDFLSYEKWTMSGRLGLSMYKLMDFERRFNPELIVPLTFSLRYGKKHQAELGVGPSFSSFPVLKQMEKQRAFLLSANFMLGYRYTTAKHFFYRLAFTPMYETNKSFRPWFGLAIGKRL